MSLHTPCWIRRTAATLLFLSPAAALAANGINLTGFGTESSVMGGADIALARDTTAPGTNPAGLTQIDHGAFDIYASPYSVTDVSHNDSLGNDKGISNPVGLIFGGGYAHHTPGSPLHFGVGVFVSAGIGFVYKNLDNVFGTSDTARALLGVSRVAPAVAWKVNDRLSLGLTVSPVYSAIHQTFLPGTSVANAQNPQLSFFGFDFDKAQGVSMSARAGLQYRVCDQLLVALAYASRTPVRLRGGNVRVNYSAINEGIVTYNNADFEGLNLPQEITIGLRYEPSDRLMWVFEVNWMNWDDAINNTVLTGRNPNNPNVASQYRIESNIDFRDQFVLSVGMVQQWNEKTRLRAGINYAHRPIPDKNLSPIFPIIQAPHIAAGVSRIVAQGWELGLGLEFQPLQAVNYDTPGGVFGEQAEERNEAFLLHMMVSHRW
ncbi:MAG: OmpP1/FadL family transporter [Panacagrimonas sp.]